MEEITHYMSIIKKHIHSFMTESFKPYNITGAEASFVKEIAIRKNCRQSELSKFFSCDKAHTHRIVSKLIDKKLIQFSKPNSQELELTSYGNNIIDKIDTTIENVANKLKEGLSQEELDRVLSILAKCAENASKLKLGVYND